jgi:hypothetical protein
MDERDMDERDDEPGCISAQIEKRVQQPGYSSTGQNQLQKKQHNGELKSP